MRKSAWCEMKQSASCKIKQSVLFNKSNVSEFDEDGIWVKVVDHDHGDNDMDDDEAADEAFLLDFRHKLSFATAADDRHKFVKLMKTLDIRAYLEYYGYGEIERKHDSCPLGIFGSICENGAINCAMALLERESGLILDLELDPEQGRCPMHVAADSMSYDMIDLLLRFGAQTDLKSKDNDVWKGGFLPLSVALGKLRFHESFCDWSKKDSALEVIIKLCLPNMKIPLKVIRLLALNTERVDDIFYYYAMEGKLVEMAALLMVAHEKVMGGFGGKMFISQHLIEEIASISRDENKLMGHGNGGKWGPVHGNGGKWGPVHGNGGKWGPVFKDKKQLITSALELLQVFERAGDCIGAYVRSVQSDMTEQEAVKDIIGLLEGNGFVLKSEDINLSNIDGAPYLESGITKQTRLSENRSSFGYPSQNLGKPFLSRSRHAYARKDPNPNKFHEMNEAKKALSPLRFFRPRMDGINLNSPFKKGWHDDQPFKKRKSLQEILSAKTYGRFGLLIKRGIRHI